MNEGTTIEIFNCLFEVGEDGALIIDSNPDILDYVFDGKRLEDNISENIKDIPEEYGTYKCVIEAQHVKYWTECGYEYDCYTTIKYVKKSNSFVL